MQSCPGIAVTERSSHMMGLWLVFNPHTSVLHCFLHEFRPSLHCTCRSTHRWESSLWLDGRQVYLGGFATEDDAAKAYDLAVIGCRGPSAELNFPEADYSQILSTDLAGLSQVGALAMSCVARVMRYPTTLLPLTGQPAIQACVSRNELHQAAVGSDIHLLSVWALPV